MNEHDLSRLREVLLNEFNDDELAALCHDVGLNYEKLRGVGVFGKTREIISAAQARHATPLLLARVQELRPDAFNRPEGAPPRRPQPPPKAAAQPAQGAPFEPLQ